MPTWDEPRYDRPIFEHPASSASQRRLLRLGLQGRLLLFALGLVSLLGWGLYAGLRPPTDEVFLDSYQVVEVGLRTFRVLVPAEGSIVPTSLHIVPAMVEARVAEVASRPGDDVEAGAVLLRLDAPGLREELAEKRFAVARLRVELALVDAVAIRELTQLEADLLEQVEARGRAEAELDRIRALFRAGAVSQAQLAEQEARVAELLRRQVRLEEELAAARHEAVLRKRLIETQLEAALDEVARLEARAGLLEVRAPFSGRILQGDWTVGALVAEGAELFRVADLSSQVARLEIPARQVNQVKPGQAATLYVEGTAWPGKVRSVAPLARQTDHGTTVEVLVELADPDVPARLRPFAPVTAEIEVGRLEGQPYLPRGPFYTSGEGSFVYKVTDDGRAVRTDVSYGLVDGTALQILAGLKPGDRIIYSSYVGFRDRREIRLAPEGMRQVGL